MEILTTSCIGGEPLPERLRRVFEQLSGYDLGDVRVYADSPWPARIGARAFVLGSDIHLSPGAADALGHEAWHAVQQKQGRVHATRTTLDAVGLNDEAALEREADLMGHLAWSLARRGGTVPVPFPLRVATPPTPVLQRQVTVQGLAIDNAATLETEIKTRLYLVDSDVVDFDNILADMLNEDLVFPNWTALKKELRIREVGYQAVTRMRALAALHGPRWTTAHNRYTAELAQAETDTPDDVDQAFQARLEQRIFDEEQVIRWGNASYFRYQARQRQLFQWLAGARNEDPFVMNCWEAVLYALVKTQLVPKSYITWCIRQEEAKSDLMTAMVNPINLAASMIKNMDYFFWANGLGCGIDQTKKKRIPSPVNDQSQSIKIAADRVIPKGRVLMFGFNQHVALSTGTINHNGEHGILELDSVTKTIREGTIEGLSSLYLASMVVAPFPITSEGTFTVSQEDSDKTKKRLAIKQSTNKTYMPRKQKVRALSDQKVEALQKKKALPENASRQQEFDNEILAEEKACLQRLDKISAEQDVKVEKLLSEWESQREPPNIEVFTFRYPAIDPYGGDVEFP
ncbi:DUF4157 domain-containing protein [Pyxidicoccus caerfyrddinensis]|uniref:eCIS core domain-containing protein n=1 Tax=Pyxidicoccus caerfyrddinensis TaxID=2709663 RepID=UPI0013DD5EFE|nr:DUF4157 domain-containing protein [Pyxidicoccus caerfyrddinensis]